MGLKSDDWGLSLALHTDTDQIQVFPSFYVALIGSTAVRPTWSSIAEICRHFGIRTVSTPI